MTSASLVLETVFETHLIRTAAVFTAVTILFLGIRNVFRMWMKFSNFFDDWNGTTGRPGVDALPGVMARIHNIEHEIRENNGGSIKDATKRIEEKVNSIESEVQRITVGIATASTERDSILKAVVADREQVMEALHLEVPDPEYAKYIHTDQDK